MHSLSAFLHTIITLRSMWFQGDTALSLCSVPIIIIEKIQWIQLAEQWKIWYNNNGNTVQSPTYGSARNLISHLSHKLCAVLPEDNTAISEYADFGEASMNRTIWKAVFFKTLTIFAVLTVLLIALLYTFIAQPLPPEMSVIGGADVPTFHFLLQQLLTHPICYIWLGVLLTMMISLIGWRTAK